MRAEHVAAEVAVRGRDGREALPVAPDDKVSQPHKRLQACLEDGTVCCCFERGEALRRIIGREGVRAVEILLSRGEDG